MTSPHVEGHRQRSWRGGRCRRWLVGDRRQRHVELLPGGGARRDRDGEHHALDLDLDRGTGAGTVRAHLGFGRIAACRFRNRGTEYVSGSGVEWISGSTKRQCDRALDRPR
jgi:hypothetical protein